MDLSTRLDRIFSGISSCCLFCQTLPTLPRVTVELQRNSIRSSLLLRLLGGVVLVFSVGCTSVGEWIHNGFKVGPNYQKPPAPVASEWIDSKAHGVNVATQDLRGWWLVFNDAKLNGLIEQAYQQNLTLRSAGTRILAARAQRNIAAGNLFPQTQQLSADYTHTMLSRNVANPVSRDLRWDHLWYSVLQ